MKYIFYYLVILLFGVMGCESAQKHNKADKTSLDTSQWAGSKVYKEDDFVKGCIIKCKNFKLKYYNVYLFSDLSPFGINIESSNMDTGHVQRPILRGEYNFTIYYEDDTCRWDGKWIFCKRVKIDKDNQIVELEIPEHGRGVTVDFTNAEIGKIFKKYGNGAKPYYYFIGGLFELYENGEKTSYKEWVHFRLEDLLKNNVVSSVDECVYMKPGKYRLRLFFRRSRLNLLENGMLDGREIGNIDFEITDDKYSVLKLKL